jgi:hypothetical protein
MSAQGVRREKRALSSGSIVAWASAKTDAKRKRLYDAIENGVADLSAPMLKDRVAELKAIRDQARADAERARQAGLPSACGPSWVAIAAIASAR